MDKIFTSEIGKSSVYKSPTVAEEQIVIDRTFETVIALSGDVVVTRDKEAFINKKSPINRTLNTTSKTSSLLRLKSNITQTEVIGG